MTSRHSFIYMPLPQVSRVRVEIVDGIACGGGIRT
jgi:hypothetical protein